MAETIYKKIIIFIIIMLVIPLVNAGWGDDGWGECGWGEECPIVEEEPITDLTSPAGSQTGDRTPEQIAMDTVPDGKEDCEEKGFIFYQGKCYECNSKSGRLVTNQETGEIMCQTCGTGYLITEEGKCIRDKGYTTELLANAETMIKENVVLALLMGLVLSVILVGVYKERKKKKKTFKEYAKKKEMEGMEKRDIKKRFKEYLKKQKEEE